MSTRIDELILKLNALSLVDTGDLEDSIPEEVKAEYPELAELNIVADDLDPDEHRWYVLSTSVIAVGDEYMGVTVVSTVKSESMGAVDVGNTLEFVKMKKVMVESFEVAQGIEAASPTEGRDTAESPVAASDAPQ